MPRQVAPRAPEEFNIVLSKPFSGNPEHQIEVIGELNRSSSIRMTNYNGASKSSEKTGDVPKDDVQELVDLINTLRGFTSHPSKDVYGLDTRVDFNTFEIQWSNMDDDPVSGAVSEIAAEQKEEFKRIVDSIEALGRAFAKKDSAV